MSRSLLRLPSKLVAQGKLLLRDPQQFFANVDLTRHPEKLQRKLMGFEVMPPLHVRIGPGLVPHVNVLLPKLDPASLTGGPNTALVIACALSALGLPVRLLAVDQPLPADAGALRNHMSKVAGQGRAAVDIVLGSTIDADQPFEIGERDVFLATFWTTAFRLKPILGRMKTAEFLYLIQDFEPSFYPWSSAYAQALETYSMPYRALINERLLADFFIDTQTGRFAEAGFIDRCAVFEPAVDRQHFHPGSMAGHVARTLLFYARPNQPRNLFGIGLEALRAAVADPVFAGAEWQFRSIGGGASLGEPDASWRGACAGAPAVGCLSMRMPH